MNIPSTTVIKKIEWSDRRAVNAFVDFPFELYKTNRLWVPEMRRTTRQVLNRNAHPFYEHSDAAFFIALQNGKTVGRIAALENRSYNAYKRANCGFFGYFEVIEAESVSKQLFDACVQWCQKRRLTSIIGPRGMMGLDGKVLVSGFELPPSLGESYNFDYYDRLIQGYGFIPESDYLTGYFPATARPNERFKRVADRIKKRGNFNVKSFRSRREAIEWLPKLFEIQRDAFSQTRTYYPVSERELENTISGLKFVADHRLIKVLMKQDEPVGLLLALPDISNGIRRAKGKIFPIGWLFILLEKWRTNQIIMPAIGILPRFAGLGGNALLHQEIANSVNHSRFKSVEVGPIDSENKPSLKDMEKQGATWTKRHRLYELAI